MSDPATPPKPPGCESCRHWVRLGHGEQKGVCRFLPPTAIAVGCSVWPTTHGTRDCCGQHDPLPDGSEPAEKQKYKAPTPAYMRGKEQR